MLILADLASNVALLAGRGAPPVSAERIDHPATVRPALADKVVIVTGSGRLRDVYCDPAANLGAIRINADGATGQLHTSPRRLVERVTSEFNSHLAVHNDQVGRSGTNFHALIPAQPPPVGRGAPVTQVPL